MDGLARVPERIETVEIACQGGSPAVARAADALARDLKAAGIRVEGPDAESDLVIVLGGDGFLLHTIAGHQYPARPFLGVNFGQVGFLMNPRETLRDLPALLRERRFDALPFPVLEAEFARRDSGVDRCFAVNDIVLDRQGPQTAHLEIFIDGVLLNRFSGDGLIVSTPAGSTAYNLAAGGPALHPAVHGIVVTPLYPHRPVQFHSLQFPVVVPLEARVRVEGIEVDKRPVRLLADGRTHDGVRRASIGFAGRAVTLLRARGFHFVDALVRKVIGLPNEEATP